jgi:hypothetical protein
MTSKGRPELDLDTIVDEADTRFRPGRAQSGGVGSERVCGPLDCD